MRLLAHPECKIQSPPSPGLPGDGGCHAQSETACPGTLERVGKRRH